MVCFQCGPNAFAETRDDTIKVSWLASISEVQRGFDRKSRVNSVNAVLQQKGLQGRAYPGISQQVVLIKLKTNKKDLSKDEATTLVKEIMKEAYAKEK